MSARDSPTSFGSPESLPYQIDDENSQSTYLECENQLHYYEKYYDKMGEWPPETGWNPPISDEHCETEESAMGTEKKKQGMDTSCGTQNVLDTHRAHKRRRSTGDSGGGSDKENSQAPSTRKASRSRKERNAVTLLRNAVRLSQKAVSLSEEAVSLSQIAISLLNEEI